MKKAVLAILFALPTAAFAATDYVWLEYGPNGRMARAIVAGNGPCPNIIINNQSQPMTVRATATSDYDVTSCEAPIPGGTGSASIDGTSLPVSKLGSTGKIAILGDTGCRLKVSGGKPDIQDCSDPNAWPFATNAQSIADWDPDLVIHVGDYYYREAKQDQNGNWVKAGYNWKGWKADFFDPAKPLLHNAPWIFVRGNHEDCERAAAGWFRFLDPNRYSWEGKSQCASNLDYTPPYTVTVGTDSFTIIDTSAVDDTNLDQDEADLYQSQLELIAATAPSGTWLLLHVPFWVLESNTTGTPTMYTAWAQANPKPAAGLVVSGHKHLLETLDFTDGGMPQIVVGSGGTELTGSPSKPVGTSINGRIVKDLYVRDNWGFMAATNNEPGWSMQVMSEKGNVKANCTVSASSFVCR